MLQAVFYVCCGIVLLSAGYAVICTNLVRAVFSFFVSLLTLACIYIFAFADFVAITQIMVYVGGIAVLMLFGIMLSNRQQLNALKNAETEFNSRKMQFWGGVSISLMVLAVLLSIVWAGHFSRLNWIKNGEIYNGSEDTAVHLGIGFMTSYLLPFEVISVYLLAILVGASYLARKKKGGTAC